jgi:hypothetical protein
MTAVAHNARSYDAYFVYNYLLANGITPAIVFNGSKIMYCHVKNQLNIRLLDSLNFLPMPLSDLPASFGLQELKKGYFPHLYNSEKVLTTSGSRYLSHLPDISYYDCDSMKVPNREVFLRWHEQNKNKAFNFDEELESYCRSDVDILLRACWEFRGLFMESTMAGAPLDPFDYITIASLCMATFRAKFLPENWWVLLEENANPSCYHRSVRCGCMWTEACKPYAESSLKKVDQGVLSEMQAPPVAAFFKDSPIGLLPVHNYNRKDNQSLEAGAWLAYMQRKMRKRYRMPALRIQQACSPEGEKKVFYRESGGKLRHMWLDGFFVDPNGSKHALEYNGCWYHGCPKCFPHQRTLIKVFDKTLEQRYRDTERKLETLKYLGFKVHVVWSCTPSVQKIRKKEAQLDQAEVEKKHSHIEVRDAYFGGRTNAIRLKEVFGKNSAAGYVDFCSLYPYVMKYGTYPIGHPQRIFQNFRPLHFKFCYEEPCAYLDMKGPCYNSHVVFPYFGLIKAELLPPRGLLFPVLPVKINNKLMFPLCRTCACAEEVRKRCCCDDEQRSLTGTWCTPEVELALNVGYRIVKIMEVLHWEESGSETAGSGGGSLFTGYVNTFLKIKAEASGYPAWVRDDKDKSAYINNYKRCEQVQLSHEKIRKNPGLRSIGKLALNSLYGKFGQKSDMKQTVFILDHSTLYNILSDNAKVIKDFHVLDNNMVLMEYTHNQDFSKPDPKTNVVIAAFCAAYARIKLWKLMFKLGKRVMYHDTDSVIFECTPNSWIPPVGEFLGDLTNELSCKNIGCKGCSTGHWIVDFVSCGAKNYAYKLNTGEVSCKVRGFSLNFSASQIVNMDSMKDALVSWKNNSCRQELQTVKAMILRKKKEAVVYTKLMVKNYGVVYNKRVVLSDYKTLPYGY